MAWKHPTAPPLPSRRAPLRHRRASALALLALLAACQDREGTLEADKATPPAAAARSLTTSSPERPAAFAIYPDIEPALITQMRSGVENQVAVWMEFTQGISSPSQLASSHFASGNARHNYLGKLSGYEGRYADPWLAQETGTARQRIYLVGVTAGSARTDPNALVRWYSDNGGFSWSSPAAIIKYAGPAPCMVDKPTVAVSAAPGSAGYVYVVYNRQAATIREQVIQVSTDGGTTWKGPFPVGNQAAGNHNAPQVMVDSNGDVYVVWARWRPTVNGDSMRVARSPAYVAGATSMTFTDGPVLSIGRVNDASHTFACGGTCRVRDASVPIARLDAARRRIAVAWHGFRATGGTEIRFTTVSIANNSMAWGPQITLPWNGGNDVQPSMDFDAQGNYLVSYYAFGLNSPIYYNVARYVTFSGNMPVVEDAGQNVPVLSGTASDVSQYPVDASGIRHLGEYHDVSFSNGTFKTVGIQIVAGTGNPYVFTTTHN
jgi:hypothetical protein